MKSELHTTPPNVDANTVEMHLRLEAWLGIDRGGDAQMWLAEQSAYDMWQAEQRLKEHPLHVQQAPRLDSASRPH